MLRNGARFVFETDIQMHLMKKLFCFAASMTLLFLGTGLAFAGNLPDNRVSDVFNTRHNLAADTVPDLPGGAPRNVYAVTENEICVFCHTPHAAQKTLSPTPLWNRKLSTAKYTTYSSSSIDATDISDPNGISKLCLSCHDGTLAIGAVNVLNGKANSSPIAMTGTGAAGVMPDGYGASTGFTRNLGIDLSNDHPISFTFDTTLANADGELRDPGVVTHIGNRISGQAPPLVPLENNQVQCNSCHDPHIRDVDKQKSIKFLRLNRFQQSNPSGGAFDPATDIICLACHDKEGWAGSAHANDLVGDEQYSVNAAALREFPTNTKVWEAACLNCHDTHTVAGSRRLLREGVTGGYTPKLGGTPAIEETCWTCHSNDGGTLLNQGNNSQVPNIKTDFTSPGNRHMPITSDDQPNPDKTIEIHDIGGSGQAGKDFIESQENLGKGNLFNRHAECTDCHNPHRVRKNRLFYGDTATPDAEGTHNHHREDISGNPEQVHTNIASGVLRGTWGVEPSLYASDAFMSEPTVFDIKRGDPGLNVDTSKSAPYVTREYQICLKCHSNFAYDTPPNLDSFGGGTASAQAYPAGMSQYTNQAMEFQAPEGHRGEGTATSDSGASPNFINNNHRGWHPVMDITGRNTSERNADADLWLPPFNLGVGMQTMYCSDCHGSATAPGTAVPNGDINGNPWGPHGSSNNFILKGPWNGNAGTNNPDHLCFKCHRYEDYADPFNNNPHQSGFRRTTAQGMCMNRNLQDVNLHIGHANRIGRLRCNWCHTTVPHGWKNKQLLVNLNDVGPEVGLPAGTHRNPPFTQAPYYNNAMLTIQSFATSGTWSPNNCSGVMWMRGTCNSPP
jgi:hypothetical protein